MSNDNSVCSRTDCAEANGSIQQVKTTISQVWATIESDYAKHIYAGEVCTIKHNHAKSPKCEVGHKCDECESIHGSESDAENCCGGWICNHCGDTHNDTYYGDPKSAAAECCYYHCDTCGFGGWADDHYDHHCDDGKGPMRRAMPWEARGIKVDARKANTDYGTVWGFDPSKCDIVRAAADYYLLEAISAGLVGTTDGKGTVHAMLRESLPVKLVKNEAERQMSALVSRVDPVLIAYTHMAVGGELRHHNAVGGEVLSSGNRDRAWSGWKLIFEAVGNDALTDAAELFREFTGGAFGGEPWAQAAEILHKRLTKAITPRLFLDRIFNAQHNGGCLLNKVTWGEQSSRRANTAAEFAKFVDLDDMTHQVLPAHGEAPEPDYPVLLAYATQAVRDLYHEAWEAAGHAAKEWGLLSLRGAKPRRGMTKSERRYAAQVAEEKQYAAYAHLEDGVYYAKCVANSLKNMSKHLEAAFAEAAANALVDDPSNPHKDSGFVAIPCGCAPECTMSNNTYKSTYSAEYVTAYYNDAMKYQAILDKLQLGYEAKLAKDADALLESLLSE